MQQSVGCCGKVYALAENARMCKGFSMRGNSNRYSGSATVLENIFM